MIYAPIGYVASSSAFLQLVAVVFWVFAFLLVSHGALSVLLGPDVLETMKSVPEVFAVAFAIVFVLPRGVGLMPFSGVIRDLP